MDLIQINFGEDLPTNALNKLRFRMEMEAWKRRWREAEAEKDYARMDRLQTEYEMVGLP